MRLLKLKSVLVAADLDEGSTPALRTASRLARLAEAELHLLHVAGAPIPGGVDRLREQLARASPDGRELASIQLLRGSPPGVIVEEAARLGADAVILGPHRRGTGEMGSTAASVVRTAPCPCLVAAAELRLPLERVLAPIDVSDVASGTLAVALSWASALRPREAPVHLTALHVIADPHPADAAQRVHEEVQRACVRAGGAAHVDVREEITPGDDPAETILREAAAGAADLLVIGTRRPGSETSGIGSVSAAVARATTCPLLLVPPRISLALKVEP